MCNKDYNVWRMVGKDLDTLDAATGDKETVMNINANDGDIVGFSVGENYTRAQLAQTLLSLELEGEKYMTNVPLTQLLPDGDRHMWPLARKIQAGYKLKATLKHRVNTLASANPIVLICHHNTPPNCK